MGQPPVLTSPTQKLDSKNSSEINERFIAPGVLRTWQLIRFRRFRSSLLALASLDLACRDHRPDFSATFTTMAFDDSSLQWLGISDLIAEPEGPSFISRTVTQPPCGPALLVTQDPMQTFARSEGCKRRSCNFCASSGESVGGCGGRRRICAVS